MADSVTTQIIENGSRNLIMKFTNVSDGTGESAVTKVDATTLGLTTHLKVRKINFSVTGGAVRMLWDATADVTFAYISGYGEYDVTDTQGFFNDAGAGVTSSIQFTTSGFAAPSASVPASGYTIVLYMIKGA